MVKRRKSLRKEVLKLTVEDKEARLHMTLKDDKLRVKEESLKKNPNKISFGKIINIGAKLEGCAYDDGYRDTCLIFLNDDFIVIDKFHFRKLLSLTMKMGRYLGILGRKRQK